GAPGRGPGQAGDGRPKPISAREQPADGAIVLSSRSHGDVDMLTEFLADETVLGHRTAGSSLKFCLIAEGVADLYPRLGRTMEWDTAAGPAGRPPARGPPPTEGRGRARLRQARVREPALRRARPPSGPLSAAQSA